MNLRSTALIVLGLGLSAIPAAADESPKASADSTAKPSMADTAIYVLPPVEVVGSYEGSLAPRSAASQGLLPPAKLALRPLLRAGDVLEAIPGLLISQHSGEGKANQYYLRGFNLDHGTDFATTIAGVPVNMPTHTHGQGYTDLSFMIPELISGVQYRKGTYSVEDGDFSSAGSARISYRNTLPGPTVSLTPGQEGYRRAFVSASPRLTFGDLLGAIELVRNDGPWIHPDDYRKVNGLVRYSHGSPERGLSVTAMGYDGRWNATDQIPERALASGEVTRFGAIDPTDGGSTSRYSLSGEFQDIVRQSLIKASVYVMSSRLHLFSNFTYFLSDTLHGDQFEQADDRAVTGLRVTRVTTEGSRGQVQLMVGAELRHDNIAPVGLYHSEARNRLATIREDHILETSASAFETMDAQWLSVLRTNVGVRVDAYQFSVASSYEPFSGTDAAAIISPKASVILGPWGGLDLYVNGGYGFHSSDARAARFSPRNAVSGLQVTPLHIPVPPPPGETLSDPTTGRTALLTRTKGAEIGARFSDRAHGSLTTSFWGLDIASEHVFLGDAGLTAANRPSRRTGIELSGEFLPGRGVHMDADLAYSQARFRDKDPAGPHIPGAVEGVVSAGIGYQHRSGTLGEVRLRYFGPRPLNEDNTVRSHSSTILNAKLGYHAHKRWSAVVEVFNLLNREASDVDYFYTSRLAGEPAAGIADVHTHPQAPRAIRLVLSTSAPM